MAVLISSATGNLTAAGSWALVDSVSYNNSEAANTALTTSSVASSTFVPAAVAIDAVAVKLASRAVSPSGTVTVELFNSTGGSIALTQTINVSDLPAATVALADGGWIVFKFGGTVTPNGTDSYSIRAKTSIAAQVNLFSLLTTNWARAIRTTTNQAPVAGDDMIVAGAWTAPATLSSIVITNNQTVATDYGSATTSQVTPAVAICQGGTLAQSSGSAANPYLRVSGCIGIYNGGTLTEGTAGSPIPSNSIAILELDCAADGDFGIFNRNGTRSRYGSPRTAGKNVTWCLLNADAAVNATSLTVDTDTGWLTGDEIAVASTIKPGAVQWENGTLNGNAGASTLTVNGFAGVAGGLAFSHLGGSTALSAATVTMPDGTTRSIKMQAEIINLTRNVIFRSTLSTAMTYDYNVGAASYTAYWSRYRYMGAGAAGKLGLQLDINASGFYDVQNNSFDTFKCNSGGSPIELATTTTNMYGGNVKNNVFNKIGGTPTAGFASSAMVQVTTAKTGGSAGYVIDGNVLIGGSSNAGITLNDITGTATNNRFTGMVGGSGMYLGQQTVTATPGAFDGNVTHSNSYYEALKWTQWLTADFNNWAIWRNSETNGTIYASFTASQIRMSEMKMWGNQWGITAAGSFNMWLRDSFCVGDNSQATVTGFFLDAALQSIRLDNVTFTSTNNFLVPVQSDIGLGTGSPSLLNAKIIGRNVTFGGTTINGVNSPNLLTDDGYISIERLGGTAGNHKTWLKGGTITIDTVLFNTASPSVRLTPTSASVKLPTAPVFRGIKVPVANGVAGKTVSVFVRKSVVGDGTAYNGNQPRLVQRANYALGQTADVVLATAAAAAGTWEKLTGTLSTPTDDGAFEVFVDCDGTTGWVNVDDWTTT
jgi:hypothetical protein